MDKRAASGECGVKEHATIQPPDPFPFTGLPPRTHSHSHSRRDSCASACLPVCLHTLRPIDVWPPLQLKAERHSVQPQPHSWLLAGRLEAWVHSTVRLLKHPAFFSSSCSCSASSSSSRFLHTELAVPRYCLELATHTQQESFVISGHPPTYSLFLARDSSLAGWLSTFLTFLCFLTFGLQKPKTTFPLDTGKQGLEAEMGDFWGDDGYDYDSYGRRKPRRPSPHQFHSTADRDGFLMAGVTGGGLHRSRSTGHGPAPTINVYNRVEQDGPNIPYPPYPYPPSPTSRKSSPRASPDSRSRGRSRIGDRLGDQLAEDLAEIALEHRFRSRSRGRSDVSGWGPPGQMPGGYPNGLAEWQLAQREAQLRELSREARRKEEEENIRRRLKIEQLEAEAREKEERAERKRHDDQLLADLKRKEDEAKAKQKAAEREWEIKKAEAERERKAEEQALREKFDREAKEKKDKERKAYEEFKRKEREDAEEEKRKWDEFERKRKEKEEKEKKKKQDEEKAFQEEMRERLRALGYTEQTIDVMVDKEKTQQFKTEVNHNPQNTSSTTSRTTIHEDRINIFRPPQSPVYPKVHKNYLATETLKYYDLPWEYDRVSRFSQI